MWAKPGTARGPGPSAEPRLNLPLPPSGIPSPLQTRNFTLIAAGLLGEHVVGEHSLLGLGMRLRLQRDQSLGLQGAGKHIH